MNPMIVVACLALACGAHASGWTGPPANIALSQDGRNILDTPEVAQARSAHYAALQKASQNNPNPQDDGSYDPRWNNEEYWQGGEQKWNGGAAQQWNAGAAQQWNGNSGQWNDNSGQWNNDNNGQWNNDNNGQWHDDTASQWNDNSGQWNGAAANQWNAAGHGPAPVAETPEVAQARAAHLAALSAANSAPAHNQWNAPAHNQWNAPAQKWNGAPTWQGPPAQIRLAQNGAGILETPEVAAARAAHLAAHSQVAHAAPAHPQQHW